MSEHDDGKLGDGINEVINTLIGWGIKVNPSSRLGQMRSAIMAPWSTFGSTKYRIAAQAFVDVAEILNIIRALGQPTPGSVHERLLREIIYDTALPQDGSDHSPGRDAQFHLSLATHVANAGLRPRFEEPDLRCDFEGITIGLAAKRLKSADNLENTIRTARRQIVGQQIPGVIALEVTKAGNEDNNPIDPKMSRELFYAIRQKFWEGFTRHHLKEITNWIGTTWVRGILLFDTQLHLVYSHEHIPRSYVGAIPLCADHAGRRSEFMRFYKTMQKGGRSRPSGIIPPHPPE